MGDRQHVAAGLVLVGLHPFPQIARIVAATVASTVKGSTRLALSPTVAEDDIAVEIVAAGIRGPFIADERGEAARIVGFFGRLDRLLPGGAIGRRSWKRGEGGRERALGEGDNDLDRGVGALARLDHVVPAPARRIGEQVRIAGKELWEEPHIVGVVGDDQEIERSRQLRRLARRSRDLLAFGKAIGVGWAEPRAEGARVERERRVEMRVAEERPGREIAAGVGRIGRLAGKTFSAVALSSVPTSDTGASCGEGRQW